MKKNKFSKNWIIKQKRDIYVKQSKIEGYRSRAVYKLQEINKKFKILKNGIRLVDLGAAPGSWSQFVSKNFKNTKIVSIDLKEMKEINDIHQIVGDFTNDHQKNKIIEYFDGKIDAVISDMAVNTTGNKSIDSIVTGELSIEALNFSTQTLKFTLDITLPTYHLVDPVSPKAQVVDIFNENHFLAQEVTHES